MATIQIPNLGAAIGLDGTELMEVVQAGTSKRVNIAQIASLAAGGGGIVPFPVTVGGTGNSTLTANGLLYGNGVSAIGVTAAGVSGQILIGNTSGSPQWSSTPTISGSLTTPTVIGGTTASSTLTLQSTSGVGTTDSILFKVGNNGAVTAATINSTGNIGIGSVAQTSSTIRVGKNITGSTSYSSFYNDSTIQSDVTSFVYGYYTNLTTAAAAFTLTNLRHFNAGQITFGAGSTVQNQIGYNSSGSLIGATNNYGFSAGDSAAVTAGKNAYGFYSSVNIATGGGTTWAFYGNGTAWSQFNGSIGIGTSPLAERNLHLGKSITGGVAAYAMESNGTIQSDVTSSAQYYSTTASTSAAAFTLSSLFHYRNSQGTFGAGSAVSSQYGFHSASTLIGATNNYAFYANDTSAITAGKIAFGFFSNINTATGGGTSYGVYAGGTAPNVFNGSVGIGTSILTGYNLRISKNITGAVLSYGTFVDGTVQSDVTSSAFMYGSFASTAAAAFTLTNLRHFDAVQSTFGAGSTVSNQFGFISNPSLIGATTNYAFYAADTAAVTAGKTAYGFYSNVNTATGGGTTYGFYASGTAPNVLNGSVGIGTTVLTGYNLNIIKNTSGSANPVSLNQSVTFQSDATGSAVGYSSTLGTAAASFTLPFLVHALVSQGTFGAGSTVTNQYGFQASANLIGGTFNASFIASDTAAVTAGKTSYGFYSSINTASGGGTTWAFFGAGTAWSQFNGSVGIGAAPLADRNFYLNKNITGATSAYAMENNGVTQSDVTANSYYYSTTVGTAAAAFTVANLIHYRASQGTFGAGSTVTNQIGFSSLSSLIGGVSNYGFFANDTAAVTAGKTAVGFYSNVNTATGGGTTWGFYAAGTANNLFIGNTRIGSATAPVATLDVTGTVAASTSATTPLLLGGSAVGSTLTLQSTSGAGTTDSVVIKVGNAGAITAATFNTAGLASAFNWYGSGVQTATNTATLTTTQIASPLLIGTPTATASYTLPLASAVETAFGTPPTGVNWEFTVFTTAAFAITILTNTGWTLIGSMATAAVANSFARFRAVKTGAGAYSLYRIS